MTITDPLSTPDAIALLAAIDAGDDSCLPILADLLEEAGDPRAAGLRSYFNSIERPRLSAFGPRLPNGRFRCAWVCGKFDRGWTPLRISREAFAKMEAAETWALSSNWLDDPILLYDTPSEAYLALAEALTHA